MSRLKLLIIIMIALITAAGVFFAGRYSTATVTIRAKTLEKGTRSVYVEEQGSGRAIRTDFEVGNASGELCIYPVELPRIALNRVKIPPLAAAGKFDVAGLSLANATVSYSWDEKMACSRRSLENGVISKGECEPGSPQLVIDGDNNIVVSSIPPVGFVNSTASRIALALAAASGVLFCGFFLLRPAKGGSAAADRMTIAVRGGWLMVILLFVFQLGMLVRYAVDIPYYEEWEFFDASALPSGLSWEWVSRQVSHQRMMIYTKLMAWLNFKLFSLDFVKLKLVNYAVFGTLLLAIARFKKRVMGDEFPFFPLFMLFLLSPLAYEIHAASFQAGETFAVLCAVLMLFHLHSSDQSLKGTLLFLLCAVASMCSLSAGLVYALLFLMCDTLYTALQGRSAWRNLLLRWGVFLAVTLFWLYDFKKPGDTWAIAPPLLPFEVKFWEMFFNLLGFGFGFEIESPLPGIVCLLLLVAPVALLLKNRETRCEAATWQVTAALAGSLAVIGLITVGRGNMGFSIKVPRYAIFGMLLIPYASMAWWLALKARAWRWIALAALWGFVALTYFNDWDYGVYRDVRQQELLNLECVERYSSGSGDGNCPGSFVLPVGRYFDNARALDVHFTRQFGPGGK